MATKKTTAKKKASKKRPAKKKAAKKRPAKKKAAKKKAHSHRDAMLHWESDGLIMPWMELTEDVWMTGPLQDGHPFHYIAFKQGAKWGNAVYDSTAQDVHTIVQEPHYRSALEAARKIEAKMPPQEFSAVAFARVERPRGEAVPVSTDIKRKLMR